MKLVITFEFDRCPIDDISKIKLPIIIEGLGDNSRYIEKIEMIDKKLSDVD